MGRGQQTVTLLGLLTVCSLLALGVGTAGIDQLTSGGGQGKQIANDPSTGIEGSLRQRLVDHPGDTDAMRDLAQVLASNGNLPEAIQWYEKALTINPNDVTTRLAFARSLADGGKQTDAEIEFGKVLAAQPSNANAHFDLADLYEHWQPARIADAGREYRRVIELGPDSVLARQAAQRLVQLGLATPSLAATPAHLEATP